MGKQRIIAETGAGQHGVATATVAALSAANAPFTWAPKTWPPSASTSRACVCSVREVVGVESGSRTLKDAINEAMRDWVTNVRNSHYLLGSALGAHPYPTMVRDFQAVIGHEARAQILHGRRRVCPTHLIACVGGGSNAIGLFHEFLNDSDVKMVGVEAGGRGQRLGEHAARLPPTMVSPARDPASCRAPTPTCCRTTTARSPPPIPFPPASITPPSAPNTPGLPISVAPNTLPFPMPTPSKPLALLAH